MVIPYSYYAPKEVLAKCSSGEITLEGTISALKIRLDYYERIIRGTRDKLREIRDKCIAGNYTKEAAMALFDQTWLDFKTDKIRNFRLEFSLSKQNISLQQIEQFIENEPEVKDVINEIRAEIEGIQEPALDTQPPTQGAAAVPEECLKKLVDTGFIVKNENIRDKTIYAKTRTATAPKIYKELLKMTNDGERAKRIMLNNISGVESGLKEHLYRLARSNKE
jgi:hypothetical protein